MGNLPYDWRKPAWSVEDRVHNWRNYVSEEVRRIWPSFVDEQKRALARGFQELADREDWDLT